MSVERIFLGWDKPALPRAADALRARFGDDFDQVTIALPGARAGRRLEELLLDICGESWLPPRIGTVGEVTDALVPFSKPRASGLAREFAWITALRSIPAEGFARINAYRPSESDFGGWAALASLLRALHQELIAESKRFAEVESCEVLPRREQERWGALAAVQKHYESIISDCGQCDPHLERLRVVETGELLRAPRALVLVGVATMNKLQSALVGRAVEQGVPVLALVVAPKHEHAGFDDLGLLNTAFWANRPVPINDSDWRVTDRPVDQAVEALRFFTSVLPAGDTDDAATVCVLHDEIAPCLERALLSQGTDLRPSVGGLLARSSPYKFLDGIASWLASESASDFAALARHPWWSSARAGSGDPVGHLDRRLATGMLLRVGAADADVPDFVSRFAQLNPMPPNAWAREIRILLTALNDAEAERHDGDSLEALEALLHAVDELELIPEAIGRQSMSAVSILQFILHALRSQELPPDPRRHGVEMLGWLELPLDEAPTLAVLGFQQGTVPETVHGHAFLPDGLRQALNLPSNSDRRARDAWAIHVLSGGKRKCAWISGRHSAAGEPWLPSSFALLAAPPDSNIDVAARVRRFFPEHPQTPARAAPRDKIWKLVPPVPNKFHWPVFSATQINDYLHSPVLFWLKHVRGLREIGPEPRELDGAAFGSLAHAVLARFASVEEMRAETRGKTIRECLEELLHKEAQERFGPKPSVTLRLQVEILRRRLSDFSVQQARRAEQGWQIIYAEWPPQESECARSGVCVNVGGTSFQLRGRIDRVDLHKPTGNYCILDYKAGDRGYSRKRAFAAKQEVWLDVQLPLYRHLLRALHQVPAEASIAIGWFNLPRESDDKDCLVPDWTPEELATADQQVATAVLDIQDGKFCATEEDQLHVDEEYQPMLAGLLGLGTLDLAPAESEEESA